MNKKAFTLIELLAVIVILAIIALIAVPIVIHIINDSKKSSEEQSVELYMDSVKKAIARKQIEDTSFNPTICNIQDSGNLLCGKEEIIIDMEGIKPTKGIIEVKDNKVSYKNLKLKETYFNRLATPVQDNNNNGKPDIGDKYTYKVNDTDTFNFYVLSFNDDDTVNLIMDRNICNDGTVNYTSANNYCRYAWHDDNDTDYLNDTNNYGPDTAMQELYAGTKNWNNVPDMIMNYIDENNSNKEKCGYKNILTNLQTKQTIIMGKNGALDTTIGTMEFPLKSRIPKRSEVYNNNIDDNTHCHDTNGSCPSWLMENLRYINVENDKYSVNSEYVSKTTIYNIIGYWLLPSYSGSTGFAHGLFYYGRGWSDFSTYGQFGVRPVITVPKDYLES